MFYSILCDIRILYMVNDIYDITYQYLFKYFKYLSKFSFSIKKKNGF